MSLIDIFRRAQKSSSEVARERLQVVISHSRRERNAPSYLPELKREIIEVIRKYTQVEQKDINISLERDGDFEVLELNITLPNAR